MSIKLKKGQFCKYDFKKYDKESKLLDGKHFAVILHTTNTPYNVALVAPITKAEALKSRDQIPDTYVELKCEKYNAVLTCDSYIDLDMILAVDLDNLECIYKGSLRVDSSLDNDDLVELDIKLVLKYELDKHFQNAITEEVKTIVEYIDDYIKNAIEKVTEIIKDSETLQQITNILISMVKEIKELYKIE